jgi:carboxymethylenebutenolidase
VSLPPHYLSLPQSRPGPGVMVLHSWWGLNTFFRGLCDRFAQAGFVALAPDLYDGQTAQTAAQARTLRARATATRRAPAYKMLIACIDQLISHDAVTGSHIAVVGFSMGGHWALWLAQRPELPIASTVVFYAARNGDFSHSHARFQFHFAQEDEWVSAASMAQMKKSLAAANRPAEYWTYPQTQHWFFENDRRESFQPSAAALAWRRSLEFLKRNGS